MTLKVPATGQAVIIDIGEAADIHPKNKQDVGKRLALWALAKPPLGLGQDLRQGRGLLRPDLQVMHEIQGDKVVLSFDSIGGGLVAKGGDPLKGFAIAGSDKKFVWADARIEGDKVIRVVAEGQVAAAPCATLGRQPRVQSLQQADLPASPFRTDDWPGITVGKKNNGALTEPSAPANNSSGELGSHDPPGGIAMSTQTAESFQTKKCRPCEGGVEKLSHQEAVDNLRLLTGWRISQDGLRWKRNGS